ncbi:TBC1 domain family member 30-like isoform X2 [Dermatophagoides pteronyssinus]
MSLINKKLKQIGRRFSVNEMEINPESGGNSNQKHRPRNSTTTEPDDNYERLEVKRLLQINPTDESGFEQWHNAMRMVARLPGGIPISFRRKLWLTLADRRLNQRQIDWHQTYDKCFSEHHNPEDEELGIQIVKDLHRTGCSLFASERRDNQALLKQVLLAYARFNQTVGYCQGFNMLAAIVLEVMEGNVHQALKVMIYLIEHVLPESYFTNNLRGLSVDMVVFRDLMHIKLPELAGHLDRLQQDSYEPTLGIYYEPPLINAFTMQWFLTLFATCLPKSTVMRIWDLILVEGNEILLRTALVIWDSLSDRIMAVTTADEFYSIMDVLTRELIEFGLADSNQLIGAICNVAPFPFPRLAEMRDSYYYNISPFNASINQLKNGLVNMFNTSMQMLLEDEPQSRSSTDNDETVNWIDDQILLLNLYLNQSQPAYKWKNSPNRSPIHSIADSGSNLIDSIRKQIHGQPINVGSLDVSLLKKQYVKLKQRQRQVQIILKEGFQNKQPYSAEDNSNTNKTTFSMARLLSGKKPLHNSRSHHGSEPVTGKSFVSRTQFNQCVYPGSSIVFKRSNTFASLPVHGNHTQQQQPTITDRNYKVNGKPTCNVIVQIQPPRSPSNENHGDCQMERKRSITPRLTKHSSGSSTSTELCDEILGIDQDDDDVLDLEYYDYSKQNVDRIGTVADDTNRLSSTSPSSSSLSLLRQQHRKPSSLSDIEEFIRHQSQQQESDEHELFTVTSNNGSFGSGTHFNDDDYDDDYDEWSYGQVFTTANNRTDRSATGDHTNDNSELDETIRRFQEQIRKVNIE